MIDLLYFIATSNCQTLDYYYLLVNGRKAWHYTEDAYKYYLIWNLLIPLQDGTAKTD